MHTSWVNYGLLSSAWSRDLSAPQRVSAVEVPGVGIGPASREAHGLGCGAADMPSRWEVTLSRGQVEITVQEERKPEVKPSVCATRS